MKSFQWSGRTQIPAVTKEISNTRQKEPTTNEMTSMIDSAYNEFNVLQDKDSEAGKPN